MTGTRQIGEIPESGGELNKRMSCLRLEALLVAIVLADVTDDLGQNLLQIFLGQLLQKLLVLGEILDSATEIGDRVRICFEVKAFGRTQQWIFFQMVTKNLVRIYNKI